MKTFKDSLKGLRKTLRSAAPALPARPQPAAEPEPDFRQLFADVKPLKPDSRHHPQPPKPSPRPRKPSRGPALSGHVEQALLLHQVGWFEPAHTLRQFARPGMPSLTLKRLRAGNWPICAQLDLHGLDRYQAQDALAVFLHRAQRDGVCVRVIHGKGFGSQGEPVLKKMVRSWLQHHPEVLAFCETCDAMGGDGALLVLLRRGARRDGDS